MVALNGVDEKYQSIIQEEYLTKCCNVGMYVCVFTEPCYKMCGGMSANVLDMAFCQNSLRHNYRVSVFNDYVIWSV